MEKPEDEKKEDEIGRGLCPQKDSPAFF